MSPGASQAAEVAAAPRGVESQRALRFKLALGAVLLAALAALSPARWAALPDLCAFHFQTGLPCAGCGLTRSWAALIHFDPVLAFRYHLFGPPLFALSVLWMIGGRWSSWMRRVPTFAVVLLGGVWLVYWILRLKGFFPIP